MTPIFSPRMQHLRCWTLLRLVRSLGVDLAKDTQDTPRILTAIDTLALHSEALMLDPLPEDLSGPRAARLLFRLRPLSDEFTKLLPAYTIFCQQHEDINSVVIEQVTAFQAWLPLRVGDLRSIVHDYGIAFARDVAEASDELQAMAIQGSVADAPIE